MRFVHRVTEIKLLLLQTYPASLAIATDGHVSSEGWTLAQLIPREYTKVPINGIYELNWVAKPPEDLVQQAIAPISAAYIWRFLPKDLKGIQVCTFTNSKVMLLDEASVLDAKVSTLVYS